MVSSAKLSRLPSRWVVCGRGCCGNWPT